jgi:hypothetical protein
MSTDDFEKTLRRQPLRQIPEEWRAGILRGANASRPSTPDRRPSLLASLLWPNPKAWAALAAVWVAIIGVQLASGDSTSKVEKKAEAPSTQTLLVLRQQRELLAQLIGRSPSSDVDRPKHILQSPRSEGRMETSLA